MNIVSGKAGWPRSSREQAREESFSRSRRRWSIALWALLVCTIVIGALHTRAANQTADAFTLNFLRMGSLDAFDSWGPMRIAIEYLRAPHDQTVYQAVFFADKVKFQYPLSSLVAIDLFQGITHLSWDTTISILNRLCWYAVWMIGFVSWRLFAHTVNQADRTASDTSRDLALLWPILGLAILFYPLSKSYALGQIQTLLTLAGALALLCWQTDRKIVAGLLIGMCCAIKPQWSVIVVWAALRREWNFIAAIVGVGTVVILAALLRYGMHDFFDYLSVLSFLGQHGEAYFPNQSINGLLNRLLHNGSNLTFDMHGFPEYRPVIASFTLLSSGAILAVAIWVRRMMKPTVLDLAIILLAATMASPIAWEHHYGVLLPIFAVMAPACVALRPWGRWGIVILVAAYILASQRIDLINRLADTPFNFVQSYLFFAAFAVWGLLFALAARWPAAAARTT